MPSAATVNIFNANTLTLQVSVNNGAQFSVAGASVPGWVPQGPAAGGSSWSNHGPAPNALGPGTNIVTVTSQGGAPIRVTVALPDVQWSSVQFYVFFSWSTVSWVALNNGQYVTGGTQSAA
jgi:hypothetical protein